MFDRNLTAPRSATQRPSIRQVRKTHHRGTLLSISATRQSCRMSSPTDEVRVHCQQGVVI